MQGELSHRAARNQDVPRGRPALELRSFCEGMSCPPGPRQIATWCFRARRSTVEEGQSVVARADKLTNRDVP